jgi:ATP-dependent protease ClpP protease subunit
MTSRIVWLVMLVVLVVLGIKTQDHFKTYFASIGTLDVRAEPSENTVYLSWTGKIAAPMASRLAEAFDAHKSDARTFVLSLSSPGGSLDQGAEVVRLLRSITATHRLVTRVGAGGLCASMCVPIYLQGQLRVAAPDAAFMFHEVAFRDFFSKEADGSVPVSSIAAETDRFIKTYFEVAGVSPEWIGSLRGQIAGGHEVWKSGRELVNEHAGIVQQLM